MSHGTRPLIARSARPPTQADRSTAIDSPLATGVEDCLDVGWRVHSRELGESEAEMAAAMFDVDVEVGNCEVVFAKLPTFAA